MLLEDPSLLSRDPRPGQMRWVQADGGKRETRMEYLGDIVHRATEIQSTGATAIQVRCRSDHPWIDFPVRKERVSEKQKRRARKEERENLG